VVVVNARHAVLTGEKMRSKVYHWHTGWMGGIKSLTARQLAERAPERLIEKAVYGMLAPNRLRTARMRRLRIFPDAEHVHARQVAVSERYAPAHLAASAPKPFSPPPEQFTGNLVRDVFPGDVARSNKALTAAAAQLQYADKAAALAELDAALAARRKAAAAPAAAAGGAGRAAGEPRVESAPKATVPRGKSPSGIGGGSKLV